MSEEPQRAEPVSRRVERRKKKKSRRKKASEVRRADESPALHKTQQKHSENLAETSLSGANPSPQHDRGVEIGAASEIPASNDPNGSCAVPTASSGPIPVLKANASPLELPRHGAIPAADATPLSPRKKALLRQKQNAGADAPPDFVSEVNQKKKNRPSSIAVEPEDGKYPMLLAGQSMDGKAQLFGAPGSQIVVYHEQLQNQRSGSSGTLLAHGEFEVFQLHNGDVTYLACGRSFVYPLLPKLKILQTSRNEFVLPLVNPERYWKIHVECSDAELCKLQSVLKDVVNYTNLASVQEDGKEQASPATGVAVTDLAPAAGALVSNPEVVATSSDPELAMASLDPGSAVKAQNHAGQTEIDQGFNTNYAPFFSDIPESPPSVPVSPQQAQFTQSVELSPLALPAAKPRISSGTSITSAMASFNLDSQATGYSRKPAKHKSEHRNPEHRVAEPSRLPDLNRQNRFPEPGRVSERIPERVPERVPERIPERIPEQNRLPEHLQSRLPEHLQSRLPENIQPAHLDSDLSLCQDISIVQPNPISHSNPFFRANFPKREAERKKSTSSSSSMDSLLDEYEDNISTTQSIHYNMSRPGSRGTSYVSTVRSGAVHQHRAYHPSQAPPKTSRYGSEKPDDFPSTSLSQYDKNRNSVSGRSRKSSVSELYSSVSNWMEPGRTGPKLSHSKSIQSLASKGASLASKGASLKSQSLAGKSRYLSHNASHGHLNSNLNDTYREIYRSITSHNLSHIVEHEGSAPPSRPVSLNKSPSLAEIRNPRASRGDGLSSAQVYKLLSERDEKQQSTGLRRLFGW